MKVYAIISNDLHIEIGTDADFVYENLTYNPMRVGKGIVGFYLKGEKILPVADLNEILNVEKGNSTLAIGFKGVVFLVWHRGLSIERPDSKQLDLEPVVERILSYLEGRDGDVDGDERLSRQLGEC